jgi:hypothetical protein
MKKFAIALCLMMNVFAASLIAVPGQVLIIPHGEINSKGNLNQKGLERAGALAAYFAQTPELLNFGLPVAIFAGRPTPNVAPFAENSNTERCLRTVYQIAYFLKLPIHPGFAQGQELALAAFILNEPSYNGRNIIICWQPEAIQELASALGVLAPAPFPVDVFNQTAIVTYGGASPSYNVVPQLLLHDDT